MARYLAGASSTAEGARGLLKEGGSSRDAVKGLVESLGGTLETSFFAFGSDDIYAIMESPDNA